MALDRITFDAAKMGGQACIRGLRIPVATVVRCVASGMSNQEILDAYPSHSTYLLPRSGRFAPIVVRSMLSANGLAAKLDCLSAPSVSTSFRSRT